MANNANNHHNAFEVTQIFAKPININQQGGGGFGSVTRITGFKT